MPLKSHSAGYGAVAIALHWTTALLILGLLASGFVAADFAPPEMRPTVLAVHVSVGILVLLLTLARVAWWRFADRRPPEVGGMPRWQARAARAVHIAFYVVIVVMAASGLATVILAGAMPILFGFSDAPLPAFRGLPPRSVHGLLAWVMIALIAVHVSAALWHQFVLGDRLLARMGVGSRG